MATTIYEPPQIDAGRLADYSGNGGNPSSSFFYAFTGVHAVHVLGGLCGLAYVITKLKCSILPRSTFAAASQYWYFMDILWRYLLLVLWML